MSWCSDEEPEPEPEPAPEPGFSGGGFGRGLGRGRGLGKERGTMTTRFRGLGVALVTPFKTDGALDEAALERFIDFQIEEGTNFLVPCGKIGRASCRERV